MTPSLSEKRIQQIVWTLLCLMPMVGMAVDLIAPSLPGIVSSLQVSNKVVKNIIAIYILGYALGNFLTGFLTDAFGRQKLLWINLFCFTIINLIPIFFPHIEILLLARFLQGAAIGATAVLIRAILSDILPSEKLVALGTLIGTMWGLGPVIGPVIGGYLQFYFGWKAGFYFFAGLSLLGLLATMRVIPETLVNHHPFTYKVIKKNLLEIVRNRLFMTVVVLMGLMYSLIISFNTSAPFLIQTELHYSPIFFGHLAFCLGLVFLLATFVCRYLLKSYKVEQLYGIILNTFFFITAILLIISYFLSESIVLLALGSALMFFACGFIFPMSIGKGMSLFRQMAGTATATMYLINMLITSLVGFLVSFVHIQSVTAMMWIYFFLIAMSFLIYWSLIHRMKE